MKIRGLFQTTLLALVLLLSSQAYAQTTSQGVADLALQIRATPAPQHVNAVAYTLELRNYGPSTASNVLVQDSFEPPFNTPGRSLQFLDVRPSQGWYDDGNGIWTVGMLPVGERATLLVVVSVSSDVTHEVVAEVIQSDQNDPDSTPANRITTEDDYVRTLLTPGIAVATSSNVATQTYYSYDSGLVNPLPAEVLASQGLPARTYSAEGVQIVHQVDNPTAEIGDLVTFTLDVHANTLEPSDVQIESKLPSGVEFVASEARIVHLTPQGETIQPLTGSYDAATGRISFNQLYTNTAANRSYGQLFVTARVLEEAPIQSCARVLSTSLVGLPVCEAMCATINNERYRYARLVAGNCCGYASSAMAAGIESNGDRAVELARRMFLQRGVNSALTVKAAMLRDLMMPFFKENTALGLKGVEGAGPTVLNELFAERGPDGSRAHVATPDDLLGLTNARYVFGVNYMEADGNRLGAAFAAATPRGVIYDHTKVTCDRLGGAELEAVELLYVEGQPFVMTKLVHPDGATDFAVSFVAYRSGDRFTVDSRFATREYFAPSSGDEVLNLQVWAADPAHTKTLVASTLQRMRAQGAVKFLNTTASRPAIPRLYVKSGRYENGQIVLDVVNEAGASQILLDGDYAQTENGARVPFTRTLPLNPSQRFTTVGLDLGSVFDAAFTISGAGAGGVDQLYYSDGAWSYAQGNARIAAFATTPAPLASARANTFPIERAASLEGDVTTWASLFRHLRSKGDATDLSQYSHLAFTASGQGRVRLVLESSTQQRYEYTFTLTNGPQRYALPLSAFMGKGRIDAAQTALIAFYVDGNGRTAQPFRLDVRDLAFTTGAGGSDRPLYGQNARRIR